LLNLQTLLGIAHWISPRLKLDESGKFFELTAKFGQPAEFAMPIEILSLGIKMFSRGLYTALVYQTKTDWKWPYWLERQGNPNDPAFQSVAHLIINQNRVFRNWTILGLPNSNQRLVVDESMMMTPHRDGYSVEVWIEFDGKIVCLGNPKHPDITNRKTFDISFPRIKQQADYFETFSIRQDVFVSSVAGSHAAFSQLKILNTSKRKQKLNVFICIRPYNVEGIAPVHSIHFDKKNNLWKADDFNALYLTSLHTTSFCSNEINGDIWNRRNEMKHSTSATCEKGLCHSASKYSYEIEAEEMINLDFVLPMIDRKKMEVLDWFDNTIFDYEKAKKRFENKWSRFTSDKMKIHLPDHELNLLTEKCINYQSVFSQEESIAPGFFIYNDFWFRDSAYLLHVLLKTGQFASVKAVLKTYPQHQHSDGFFESQEGEWDSNGEALWIVGQYYRYTQDKELVLSLWQNLISGARWIQKKRLSHSSDKSVMGLLPAGFSAEHFGQNDYYFWDDFWSLAGYRELLFLAEEFGKTKELNWMKLEFENFSKTVMEAVEKNISQNNGILTSSPKRTFDAGSVGVAAALSPLQLSGNFHDAILKTGMKLLETYSFQNCFYHPVAHTGVNIYLTLHLRHLEIITHNPSFWKNIKSVREFATENGTWPEGIHPQFKSGVMGEGHHGWANAEWVNTVRDALIYDWHDELWITPVFNSEWLNEPSRISVQNTFTPFGKVSFQIVTEKEKIRLIWEPEFFKSPKKIRWFLPDSLTVKNAVKNPDYNVIEIMLPENKGNYDFVILRNS